MVLVAPPPFGKGRLPRLGLRPGPLAGTGFPHSPSLRSVARSSLGMLAPVGRSRVPPGGSTLACGYVGLEGNRSPWRSGGRLEGGATSDPR
ncbi:MAG TPA: hypothetical protein VH599_16665 [Ktedonobacterales bacterium]